MNYWTQVTISEDINRQLTPNKFATAPNTIDRFNLQASLDFDDPYGKSKRYRTKHTCGRSQRYKCVQKSGDSRVYASHTAYRGLLRPSSLRESSHPSLRVFNFEWTHWKLRLVNVSVRRLVLIFIRSDPSAGSPTDTVVRLLHPLDDKAHDTFSRSAIDCESPSNLPDHPIGWSDGRCVQRAGT